MALRSGHGNGAGVPRIEVLPPDELPAANPGSAARSQRGPDGRFARGNTEGRVRRVRPGTGSLTGFAGLNQTCPEYHRFAQWGARYSAHRRRELAQAHGGELSSGASAIIESAAQAMAASRFVQWLAGQRGDAELFKQASQLASTARQHELAAWELASREGRVRLESEGDDVRRQQADFQRQLAERQRLMEEPK